MAEIDTFILIVKELGDRMSKLEASSIAKDLTIKNVAGFLIESGAVTRDGWNAMVKDLADEVTEKYGQHWAAPQIRAVAAATRTFTMDEQTPA